MPSSQVAPIRILICLLLLAFLPGCERTPPEASGPASVAIPEAAPVVANPAPAASPAPAAVVLPFSTDDVRIGTEIGVRTLGLGLSTTGKTGWLMFGPYIPLPAGNYQVALQGVVHEGHAGAVHVDVAQGKGTEVLAAMEIDAPALLAPSSPDGMVVLPFTLTQDSSSLEIRIRVTETSNLSVSGYVIRSVP
jgi:hypothetical protein